MLLLSKNAVIVINMLKYFIKIFNIIFFILFWALASSAYKILNYIALILLENLFVKQIIYFKEFLNISIVIKKNKW